MKILVTGGAGFIGSNFILYWLSHHKQDLIINLDKLTYAGNLDNLKTVANDPSYKFIKGDICDVNLVNEVMEGVDTVAHFAAESHVDRSIHSPSEFVLTNVVGTQVLLDAALNAKVKRFHHISTDEVFGALELNSTLKFNEKTPYNPHSPYSASKASSDHLVRAYADTYGLPTTITNCSNNFGPYQFPEKLIPLAITNLLVDKKVPVYGDGLYVRDWLHVEDHCRAIEAVLMNGRIGETYCVGGLTQDVSNLEIVKKLLVLLGKGEGMIEYVKDRPGHDRRYAVDWSKINHELGWKPAYDFDTWLDKTVTWYKENRDWWKRLKNPEFEKYYEKQYGEES
ncbi:MAG: dTDP-glucose 4,6-dehydratase [Candidatus Levyibacteriota bacterium]